MLKDIGSKDYSVHLLYSPSDLGYIYIYDTLKSKNSCNNDAIITVNSKSSFGLMRDALYVSPLTADRWLVIYECNKTTKALIKGNEQLFSLDTAEFIIRVSNYKDFKEVSNLLKGKVRLNTMYLSFMRYYDTTYLLKGLLNNKLVGYVSKAYSTDPNKIFTLYRELLEGYKVKTSKDIVNLLGVSLGTVDGLVYSLLKPVRSYKGRKRFLSNRVGSLVHLSSVYKINALRGILLKTTSNILKVKMAYLRGDIYDSIAYSSLSEADKKELKRYRLDDIKGIPLNDIVRLYLALSKEGIWYSVSDGIAFIYNYYSEMYDKLKREGK